MQQLISVLNLCLLLLRWFLQLRASIAASLPPRHAAEKARLMAHYERSMRQWYLSLSSGGFNLLCYGYGSKKQLLTQFARVWLTDGPVIVFNAYTPGANVKVVRRQPHA